MSTNVERAIRYRNKSEELRAIAEQMGCEENKRFLVSVAEDYLKMADIIEFMPSTILIPE